MQKNMHAHSKAVVHIQKCKRILNCNANGNYFRAVKLLFLFSSFCLSAFFLMEISCEDSAVAQWARTPCSHAQGPGFNPWLGN